MKVILPNDDDHETGEIKMKGGSKMTKEEAFEPSPFILASSILSVPLPPSSPRTVPPAGKQKPCGKGTRRYPPKIGECLTKSAIATRKITTRPNKIIGPKETIRPKGGKGIRDSDNTYHGLFRPKIVNARGKKIPDVYKDIIHIRGNDQDAETYGTHAMMEAAALIQSEIARFIHTTYGIEPNVGDIRKKDPTPSMLVDWEKNLEFEFRYFPHKIKVPPTNILLVDGYVITGWKYVT